MDFAGEFEAVRSFLAERGHRVAVIGGVAIYTNHRHEERRHGRVDFMYIRDTTADQVFASVIHLAGPGGRPIPVPRPEYLIAMKVKAISDAPERMWQDLADIGVLRRLENVDREEARGYFVRAGLEEKWREIDRAL